MRQRRAAAWCLAAAVTAGCHSSSPPPSRAALGVCSSPAALGNPRAGFSPGGALPTSQADRSVDDDLAGMRAAGAGWIRIDFNWSVLEPSPGALRWGHLDAVVAAARCHGLRVLALPAYTPRWARAAGTDDKFPPTDPETYARFVGAAATHFGDRVPAWELWNEPNLAQFWSPRPDPAAYGRLVRAAATRLRAVRPAAIILSGGLAPADGSGLSYLTAVIDGGGLGPVDGVAIHPYSYPKSPGEAGSAFSRLADVRALLVQRGLGGLQVWATEMGAPTGRSQIAVTDGRQAVSVAEALRQWSSPPWRSWTGALLWYSWRDAGTDPADAEQNFGLVRHDGTPKPALGAFRRAVTGP